MLDSWCIIYTQFYLRLQDLSLFFVYGLLFPKDKIISFYQFHVLYNNFGDMNTMCQLYELCMYVFIVGQKLFQLMFIFEFDPTFNKDYLISSILSCLEYRETHWGRVTLISAGKPSYH